METGANSQHHHATIKLPRRINGSTSVVSRHPSRANTNILIDTSENTSLAHLATAVARGCGLETTVAWMSPFDRMATWLPAYRRRLSSLKNTQNHRTAQNWTDEIALMPSWFEG